MLKKKPSFDMMIFEIHQSFVMTNLHHQAMIKKNQGKI